MKKALCVLLSVTLTLAGFVGLCVPVSAADISVGDFVNFGSYPQSLVTDAATIAAVEETVSDAGITDADWHEYVENNNYYLDLTVGGEKYRGVRLGRYRPKQRSSGESYQNDNGYTVNNVYWFRYEPLRWRVLDPEQGLMLCESIVDCQFYNDYAAQENGRYYGDSAKSYYANNYEKSYLRSWLNSDFLSAAFTSEQQDDITAATLDNSAFSTGFSGFDSASTTDKVFLLSYKEALNTSYGFAAGENTQDPGRRAEGSDYAKCRGLYVAQDGSSHWWLRSAGYTTLSACCVYYAGWVPNYFNVNYAYLGVRPAIKVDLESVGMTYQNGDIVEFGFYLQGKLVNEESIAALEAAAPDFSEWTSYGYYNGTGNATYGQMTAKDYMRYCEVTIDEKEYRGVRFTQYRPWQTGMQSTKTSSSQAQNGYETETTYWFRYRPLQWRVIDAKKGILLCETIIDSRPMNDYVLESGTDEYGETAFWGDAGKTRYANDYAQSDLRRWLNNDFLNTAFSPEEQAVLTYTKLDNSADDSVSRSGYGSDTTNDRVFLLSYAEAQNAAYGFTDNDSRMAKGSGYAKCQGLAVTSSYSPWLLRSPGNSSRNVILVNYKGKLFTSNYSYAADHGIRPAISVDMNAFSALTQEHTYGEPIWSWANDHSSATAKFTCADCGATKSLTDNTIDTAVVTEEGCINDRVVTYTASVKLNGTVYTGKSDEITVPDTALGHDYSVVHQTVAPTASDEGYTLYKCSRCGDVDPTHRDIVPPGSTVVSDDDISLAQWLQAKTDDFVDTDAAYTDLQVIHSEFNEKYESYKALSAQKKAYLEQAGFIDTAAVEAKLAEYRRAMDIAQLRENYYDLITGDVASFSAYDEDWVRDNPTASGILYSAQATIDSYITTLNDMDQGAVSAVFGEDYVNDVLVPLRATIAYLMDLSQFNEHKAQKKAAVDTMQLNAGDDACPGLFRKAKDDIDAIEYDDGKTIDENKAAVDAVVTALASGSLGHNYTDANWIAPVEADCGNVGSVGYYTCTGCGERFNADGDHLNDDDIVISATGDHRWETEWSNNDSKHWHECTVCGDKKDEAEHSYGDTGVDRYTCTVCSAEDAVRKAAALLADDKAALDVYKEEQSQAADNLGSEDDSDACKALIEKAKQDIAAVQYEDGESLDEKKQAVDAILEQLAADLEKQRDHEAFDAYKDEKTEAADNLGSEDDSDACKALIDKAKEDIAAVQYEDGESLDENKQAVDAILEQLAADLEKQRDHEAFDAYKEEQKAKADLLAKSGDSRECANMIAAAKEAIDAVTYDDEKSLDENKAAVDAVADLTGLAEALEAQRAAEQLERDKNAFEEYREKQLKAIEALTKEGDSEACKELIEAAKEAVEAVTYDESKSLKENKAALDRLVSGLKDDLAAQRAADEEAAKPCKVLRALIKALSGVKWSSIFSSFLHLLIAVINALIAAFKAAVIAN